MIGRINEIKELNRLYDSNRAEFVAVYGRRRVGKTYLIDETFEGRFTFRYAGLSPVGKEKKNLLKEQLDNFYESLQSFGLKASKKPKSWLEAFFLLERLLDEKDDGSRQLVFLDELPWMDTPRSNFIRAFESFWNNWGCHKKNLMLIVCGSANSWILDELINSHGGLYDRVTYEIKLSPFTLKECEAYYADNGIRFSRYDIVQSYMIFGGIPYYLNYIKPNLSLAQNVDRIFFNENAVLKPEFDRLFDSLFVNPESVRSLVKLLYTRNAGYTRAEICEKLKIADSDRLSRNLNALIASDFVIKYVPFGLNKNQKYYKLVDPFCLFYLHFMEGKDENMQDFWQRNLLGHSIVVWRGLAFENVCFNHIEPIKKALGISGVASVSSYWSIRKDDREGMQIDLLINRDDNVLNMCELKFYSGDFEVSNVYYRKLMNRQQALMEMVPRKVVVRSTLITTFGLYKNEYSGIFTNVITVDDLFE